VLVRLTSGTFYCCAAIQIRNAATNALVGNGGGIYGSSPQTALMEPVTLPAPGAYVVVVDPAYWSTGVVDVNLYDVVDVTTPITANGSTVTANLMTPGQNARLPFNGTAGERVSVRAKLTSGVFYCCAPIQIRDAVTNALVGTDGAIYGASPETALMEPVRLPATGAYVVVVDPAYYSTGVVDVNLYDVADVTTPIAANGTSVTAQLMTPGQNARLPFNGTAGERVSVVVKLTSGVFSCCALIQIRNAATNALVGTDTAFYGQSPQTALMEPVTLPATDGYVLVVDPRSYDTGEVVASLHDVVDVTGSISVNGSPIPLSLQTPGQNARLAMNGTAGQVTVRVTANSIGYTTLKVLKPDGSPLSSTASSAGSFDLTTPTLSATDMYTVVIDPYSANTGTVTVAVTSP
jgi:hypothetical protein